MEFAMLKHTGAMFVYPEQKISSYLGTRLYVPIVNLITYSILICVKYGQLHTALRIQQSKK
jgi:hypothetical protein